MPPGSAAVLPAPSRANRRRSAGAPAATWVFSVWPHIRSRTDRIATPLPGPDRDRPGAPRVVAGSPATCRYQYSRVHRRTHPTSGSNTAVTRCRTRSTGFRGRGSRHHRSRSGAEHPPTSAWSGRAFEIRVRIRWTSRRRRRSRAGLPTPTTGPELRANISTTGSNPPPSPRSRCHPSTPRSSTVPGPTSRCPAQARS
jgi:hypothetical protein